MLVACRLAGLSALEGHYASVKWRAMRGPGVAARSRLWPPEESCPLHSGHVLTKSGLIVFNQLRLLPLR